MMKILTVLILLYFPFFAHGECQMILKANPNYGDNISVLDSWLSITQQSPVGTKTKNQNAPANPKISAENRSYYVHFSSYDIYDNAVKRLNSLQQLIDKTIIIEESEENYRLISIDFLHIHEARDFLKETRGKGITCFLLRN